MTGNEFIPLFAFAALVLAASLQGLAASGHFPRGPTSSHDTMLLYGSIAVACVSLALGLVCAITLVAWYVIVIGGGLALLATPLLLQQCSDRFVNGAAALIGFAAISAALALLMLLLALHPITP